MAENGLGVVTVPHWSELLRGSKDDLDRATRDYLDAAARELSPELVRALCIWVVCSGRERSGE